MVKLENIMLSGGHIRLWMFVDGQSWHFPTKKSKVSKMFNVSLTLLCYIKAKSVKTITLNIYNNIYEWLRLSKLIKINMINI